MKKKAKRKYPVYAYRYMQRPYCTQEITKPRRVIYAINREEAIKIFKEKYGPSGPRWCAVLAKKRISVSTKESRTRNLGRQIVYA